MSINPDMKNRMFLEGNHGGQFVPAEGGQFESATHGQFKSAEGGQFDRSLHQRVVIVVLKWVEMTLKEGQCL